MNIFEAIDAKNHTLLTQLLTEQTVNSRNRKGQTPLMRACKLGDLEAVKILLAHPKTDVSAINDDTPYKSTALKYVLNVDEDGSHRAIVDALFADSRLSNTDNHYAMLYYAEVNDIPKVLECLNGNGKRECDINFCDPEHGTVLTIAADNQHMNLLRTLFIFPKLDINKPDSASATPLMLAAYAGNLDAVEALLARPGIDLHHQGYFLGTALTNAIFQMRYDVAYRLLEQEETFQDIKHPGAMLWAVRNDNPELVGKLLAKGANVNTDGGEGYIAPPPQAWEEDENSPFISSPVSNGSPVFELPVVMALRENKTKCLPVLLAANPDLNKKGTWGATAQDVIDDKDASEKAQAIIAEFLQKKNEQRPAASLEVNRSVLFPNNEALNCQTQSKTASPQTPRQNGVNGIKSI